MVVVGSFRKRAELRKKPRRRFRLSAKLLTAGNKLLRSCSISDISESGARIVLESDYELPDHFVLLLSARGSPRRNCRVVWRAGLIVGVEFPAGSS